MALLRHRIIVYMIKLWPCKIFYPILKLVVCYNKQGEEGPKAWIRGPGISKQGESEIEKVIFHSFALLQYSYIYTITRITNL